ncbi:MAG: hypothetical protein ACC707_06360, partial [Thiohalomonadales bacterium]
MIQDKLNPRLQTFILVLVGLFPMLTVTLRHGGSTIYGVLLLLGLFYARPVWIQITRLEKQFLLAFGLFALVMFLSLYNTEDWPTAGKKIERIIRLVGIIPIFLLLRRFGVETLKATVVGAGVGSIIVGIQAWYFSVIKGHTV